MPYFWMAMFGLLHGLNEWLDLLGLSMAPGVAFGTIRTLLLASSFACLLLFGLRGTEGAGRLTRPVTHFILAALAAASLLGLFHGLHAWNVTTRYCLGFTGSLWAAAAMMRLWIRGSRNDRYLRAMAAVLVVYAVAAGLIGPKCQIAPAVFLNQDQFVAFFNFPIQLVRAILALLLSSLFIFHYMRHRQRPNLIAASQRTTCRACGIIVALLVGGWFLVDSFGSREEASSRRNLLVRTAALSASITADNIRQLTGTPADTNSPAYSSLRRMLFEIGRKQDDIHYVYIMGLRDGKAFFYMDAGRLDDAGGYEPADPGDTYVEASPELLRMFSTGQPLVEGPMSDRWGNWISALVPIIDPADGRVVAVFGQDVNTEKWNSNIQLHRLVPILIVMALCVLALAVAVVARRTMEDQALLQESQDKFRALVENTPDLIMRFDSQCRHLYVSGAVRHFVPMEPEEFIGKTHGELGFPQEMARHREERIRGVFRNGEPFEEEFDQHGSSGPLTINWRLVPERNERGEVTSVLSISRDVTEEKRRMRELEHARTAMEDLNRQLEASIGEAQSLAASAEAANLAKSQFLANMSHEIRTPMNGVLGMTDLLLETELTPRQRQYAETVRDSGTLLLGVLNDVLDYSKIEAGRLLLNLGDVDPYSAVEEAVSLHAVGAHAKNVEMICHVAPDVPEWIRADGLRMRQVLANLLGNAVKFTDAGEIRVLVTRASGNGSGQLLSFEVSDTGIGIPDERQRDLFMPFVQIDAATTKNYGGTGLGLAISRKLVELMGGNISLSSRPGKGTTFTFTMRYEKALEPSPPKPAASLPANTRVLIVDDHPLRLNHLRDTLTAIGVRHDDTPDPDLVPALLRRAAEEGDAFCAILWNETVAGNDGEGKASLVLAGAGAPLPRSIVMEKHARKDGASRPFGVRLLKPVTREALVSALTAALTPWQDAAAAIHRALEPQARSERILVVEDNATNQTVAGAMLRQLGFACAMVQGGHEAIALLQAEPFDAVLMDCQMPGIDGFETTRRIRRLPGRTASIPIIAVTAYAGKSDEELCLKAGMDRYLAKPLSIRALEAALNSCLTARQGTAAGVGNVQKGPVSEGTKAFDRADLLDRFDGDQNLARTVISAFLRDVPVEVRKLEQAAAGRNAPELASLAHRLRGAAANTSAPAMAEICQGIERAAAAGSESAFAQAAHVMPAFAAAAAVMNEESSHEHVAGKGTSC